MTEVREIRILSKEITTLEHYSKTIDEMEEMLQFVVSQERAFLPEHNILVDRLIQRKCEFLNLRVEPQTTQSFEDIETVVENVKFVATKIYNFLKRIAILFYKTVVGFWIKLHDFIRPFKKTMKENEVRLEAIIARMKKQNVTQIELDLPDNLEKMLQLSDLMSNSGGKNTQAFFELIHECGSDIGNFLSSFTKAMKSKDEINFKTFYQTGLLPIAAAMGNLNDLHETNLKAEKDKVFFHDEKIVAKNWEVSLQLGTLEVDSGSKKEKITLIFDVTPRIGFSYTATKSKRIITLSELEFMHSNLATFIEGWGLIEELSLSVQKNMKENTTSLNDYIRSQYRKVTESKDEVAKNEFSSLSLVLKAASSSMITLTRVYIDAVLAGSKISNDSINAVKDLCRLIDLNLVATPD